MQVRRVTLAAAAALPVLLAYNPVPGSRVTAQCLAITLWGAVIAWSRPGPRALADASVLLLALLATVLGVVLAPLVSALPASIALAAACTLAAAALTALAGAGIGGQPTDHRLAAFDALCHGLLVAGVLSACVGFTQVIAPQLCDQVLLACSSKLGRATGNIRQPNHLATLLAWGAVAAVALQQRGRLGLAPAAACLALLMGAMALTASRIGATQVGVLMLWGLLDRRMGRAGRLLLLSCLAMYAASHWAVTAFGTAVAHPVGAAARLGTEFAAGPSPNSRLNIWANTLTLIAQQPWLGVGFGGFNFAWMLTEFPSRPTADFDHSHNLALELLVELGVPLGGLVLVALGWSAWRAVRRCRADGAAAGVPARAALVLLVMVALHSLVEYPLWYAYFLLPTAFVWGWALGLSPTTRPLAAHPEPRPWLGPALGALVTLGGVLALVDHQRVVEVYMPPNDGRALPDRISAAQHSPLFAHHADRAATMLDVDPASRALGFARAPHLLLDSRQLLAWARWCDARQQPQRASLLVQRLKVYTSPESIVFLAECHRPDAATRFQCRPPLPALPWRDFLDSSAC